MVCKCVACGKRSRDDGSCSNNACAQFRPNLNGRHWQAGRLKQCIGDLSAVTACTMDGGYFLTLGHRPDIRVMGAALSALAENGLRLRRCLWIAAHLWSLYWCWPVAAALMVTIAARLNDRSANSAWQKVMKEAKAAAIRAVAGKQVVHFLADDDVRLVERGDRVQGAACKRFHAMMNPSARRTGDVEWDLIAQDAASGRLTKLCETWAGAIEGPTRTELDLKTFLAKVPRDCAWWQKGTGYTALRFLRAVISVGGFGCAIEPSPSNWGLLRGMGSGVETGAKLARIKDLDTALDACAELARYCKYGGKFQYTLLDLSCFLCLGSKTHGAKASSSLFAPPPPPEPLTFGLAPSRSSASALAPSRSSASALAPSRSSPSVPLLAGALNRPAGTVFLSLSFLVGLVQFIVGTPRIVATCRFVHAHLRREVLTSKVRGQTANGRFVFIVHSSLRAGPW